MCVFQLVVYTSKTAILFEMFSVIFWDINQSLRSVERFQFWYHFTLQKVSFRLTIFKMTSWHSTRFSSGLTKFFPWNLNLNSRKKTSNREEIVKLLFLGKDSPSPILLRPWNVGNIKGRKQINRRLITNAREIQLHVWFKHCRAGSLKRKQPCIFILHTWCLVNESRKRFYG